MELAIVKICTMDSTEETHHLLNVITQVLKDYCSICNGKGHVPRFCSTRKLLDEHFKLMHHSICWGKVKSRAMAEGAKSRKTNLANNTQINYANAQNTIFDAIAKHKAKRVKK